jgi:hypothetical protein
MIPEVAFTDEKWFPDLARFLPADDRPFRSIGAVFSLGLGIAEELLGVAWDLASCICSGLGISCTASGGCGGGAGTCSGSDSSSTSSIGLCDLAGSFDSAGSSSEIGDAAMSATSMADSPLTTPYSAGSKRRPFRPAKQHADVNSDRKESADGIPSAGSSN